jgi:hypothetical protein
MERDKIISGFLKGFKPKEEQSWKSCYFFAYHLKKEHDIPSISFASILCSFLRW